MAAPGASTATPAAGEGARLRQKLGMVLAPLVDASYELVRHPRIADLYPQFLFTSHCIIRASVPLMDAARTRTLALPATDPVRAPLADYLEEHIPEELHHDEWLLDDLESIGVGRSAVLRRVPSPTVAELVGAQYYWILHYHPVALLGYISLLEGYPPSAEMTDELEKRTGSPAAAFRTLRLHGELDQGHRQELDELLDRLPLTREQSTAIGLSAMASVDLYTQVIDEVIAGLPRSGW
jgi:hypothetical protein